jgi:hypothetical protein
MVWLLRRSLKKLLMPFGYRPARCIFNFYSACVEASADKYAFAQASADKYAFAQA